MSYQQFQQGAGAPAYNYTAPGASSSLLNTNFAPATTTTPAPTLPGRQLANTHPCTWPGCPRFFACPHNVQQHIREKHTHEKPYKCNECFDVAFARQYGLNRHNAQVHGVGEKPSRVAAGQRTYATAPSVEQQQQPFVPYTEQTQVMTGAYGQFAAPQQPFVPYTEPTQAMTGAYGEVAAPQQPFGPYAQQTLPTLGASDDQFAVLMGWLQAQNARKEASGGDVEMSDDQFGFGADQQETAAVTMFDAQQAQVYSNAARPANPFHNNAQNGELLYCGESECDFFAATTDDVTSHMHVEHQVPHHQLCACELCTMIYSSSEIDAAQQKSMLLVQGGFQKIREDAAAFLGEGADFATAPTATTSAWQPEVNNNADYATAGTIDPALLNLAGPSGFGRHNL
jgi:hypothetical protein